MTIEAHTTETDAADARMGALIAELLHLKRDAQGRWPTAWGNKTDIGLARTLRRVLEEGQDVSYTNKTRYRYTTQRELRRAFWQEHPTLQRRRIPDYSGNGMMHVTDTRVAWCDWLDALSKDRGGISQELAQRATLD